MPAKAKPDPGDDFLFELDMVVADAAAYCRAVREATIARVAPTGKIDRALLDAKQHVVHGLAWIATYAETLREVADWARALHGKGKFSETEQLLARLIASEYSAQLAGGLPMTQGEMIRAADYGLEPPPVRMFVDQLQKTRLAALLRDGQGRATLEDTNLDDDLSLIRDEFRKFADAEVAPHAHEWHLQDELIPMP